MTTVLKPSYANNAAALTMTSLASLASSSTLVAGACSAVVDNTSNLNDDELITGIIKTGTSPTVSTFIEIWAWGILDDTPTYPDTIAGTDAAKTLTSLNTKLAGAFKRLVTITVDATSNATYPFEASLASAFDGYMPKKWGLWITQNTGAALNATQVVSRIPLQYQNV